MGLGVVVGVVAGTFLTVVWYIIEKQISRWRE